LHFDELLTALSLQDDLRGCEKTSATPVVTEQ
jgi:hypothetical protein